MYLRLLALGLTTSAVLASIAACTSDTTPGTTTTPTPDAGPTADAGPVADSGPAPVTLSITPAKANVLTCSTLQLKASGGAGNGTWAAAPSVGTISSAGLYTAPTTAPADPGVGITYTEGTASASASLQVATAFLGTPALLPIGTTSAVDENAPVDKQFTANGSTIYTTLFNKDFNHADIYSSSDNGATFTLASSYHTGYLSCASAAVDAVDPQTVYLVYYAGHGDMNVATGATMRLAVSTDGAKTFPKEYVIADSKGSIPNLICPDVTSPSGDHVVVAGVVADFGVDNSPTHVGTWTSAAKGANIGPVGTPLTCTSCPDTGIFYNTTDTNTGASVTDKGIQDDGNNFGPRLASNGKGALCVTFSYEGSPNSATEVQCSKDNGATWTTPLNLGSPSGKIHPTVAISPSGKIAVSWATDVSGKTQQFIAISSDGGTTFAAPVQHPAFDTNVEIFENPVVGWESDDILWVAATANVANFDTLYVDKTCDMGTSWSGAVQVGRFDNSSLMMTTKGMVVGGYNTSTPSVAAILLNAQQ